MAKLTLSQSLVDGLTCPAGKKKAEYVDSNRTGLYVTVTATTATYYLRHKDQNGKTCHKKLGRTSDIKLSEVRQKVKQLRSDMASGKYSDDEPVPTFSAFFTEQYLPHVKSRKRSWHKDESLFRMRLKAKFGHKRLDTITRQSVMDFHTHLLEKEGLAPATADHHLKLMRRMFNLAVEWEVIEKNPLNRIPLFNADNKVENYLNQEQLKRLLGVLHNSKNKQTCNVMLFLLTTGARLNEALSARWSNIDVDNRVWKIPATNSKSKRLRSVPLNNSAIEVLKRTATEGQFDHVFVNHRTGKPLRNVHTGWKSLRKQAGLPHLRIHDLRHSFASFLVNNGRTLYEVQQILGHSVPVVTQRYAHLSAKTLLSASDAASACIAEAQAATA